MAVGLIVKKLEKQMKFTDREFSGYSNSRLYDLRRIARIAALKVFESLNSYAEGVLKLVAENEFREKKLASEALAQSTLVQDLKRSYLKAGCSSEKERLLSLLVKQFSREGICAILEQKISAFQFHCANLHALHFGSRSSAHPLPFKHLKYSRETIEAVLAFILNYQHGHSVAHGEKKLTNSDGEMLNLINFQRILKCQKCGQHMRFKKNKSQFRTNPKYPEHCFLKQLS